MEGKGGRKWRGVGRTGGAGGEGQEGRKEEGRRWRVRAGGNGGEWVGREWQ